MKRTICFSSLSLTFIKFWFLFFLPEAIINQSYFCCSNDKTRTRNLFNLLWEQMYFIQNRLFQSTTLVIVLAGCRWGTGMVSCITRQDKGSLWYLVLCWQMIRYNIVKNDNIIHYIFKPTQPIFIVACCFRKIINKELSHNQVLFFLWSVSSRKFYYSKLCRSVKVYQINKISSPGLLT